MSVYAKDKMSVYAKFLLADMVQEKNARSGPKKCLCACTFSAVFTLCKRETHMNVLQNVYACAVVLCFHAVQEKNTCEWTEKMSVCAH